jgi:cytochrome c-type biogenesis protein
MDLSNITVGLAFLAGLASFLSPCVFSLVPAYIGYLGGRAAGGEANANNRWVTFSHGLAFVLGFSFVFIFLGLAVAAAGHFLYDLRFWLAKIGGFVVIIFGLHMIGVFRIPFLEYDVRVHTLPNPKWGYLSSALMGVFFSAGWSPCVGPVLGAILTLALNGGDLILGAKLLTAYSAGLAQQSHALRGNCHGRHSRHRRRNALARRLRTDRPARPVLLVQFRNLNSGSNSC